MPARNVATIVSPLENAEGLLFSVESTRRCSRRDDHAAGGSGPGAAAGGGAALRRNYSRTQISATTVRTVSTHSTICAVGDGSFANISTTNHTSIGTPISAVHRRSGL